MSDMRTELNDITGDNAIRPTWLEAALVAAGVLKRGAEL